jgi:chaperonin GroES
VRPIGNRILIEPSKAREASAGGILTPEAYRQRDVSHDGVVIALGSLGLTRKGVEIPFEVEVGQRVFVNRYSVVILDVTPERWMARPEDILAIIEDQ